MDYKTIILIESLLENIRTQILKKNILVKLRNTQNLVRN
uniref:Uncharacterized protein n=1 Tax=Clostridioides difficile TaxID=1496 RepID=A0A381I7N7_CLODI|nr:Uncharacterised protein [Clostridioides difficile]